ncbi:thiamine pyrophosphate-dependent dehydrogenase E1 component subunit alpha [Longimicrobium sp.]|uniref:thiamine pyrophosphate-dependent dehydrogenase E1 component subunit alpha n=1 Tax=Longimicrobium sp. TaxID=2029185 RepID=UPI002E35D880|nr:thiamine pyrophosphate-dependent dehydrogenase E1 component subunit alpha [Longimicrobium sp.]HEX6039858.1 thiamine pyrophosphate-dependent dehydrogenase E1 component subunit alpha [Longimicrobium sp.]
MPVPKTRYTDMANKTKARTEAIPHGLSREQLLEMYRLVRLTRSLEERLELLFKQSKVIGGLFRSLGQEGESVASAYALRRRDDGTGDMLSPLIRNLGSMLTIGTRPVEVVKQYMAKGDSLARGKELNIHITDFDRGFIGQISPLGDLIPVMCGVTLSFKQRRHDRVGMVYIGDGATSTGAFHEGVNLAAVQKLPLVIIVENNRWAYSTPSRFMTAAKSFVDKAPGYGMAGEQVDGNDMLAVYAASKRAVDRARAGEGPTLLEFMTYRRKGHAQHDPQTYVDPAEIEHWASTNDPIDRYVKALLDNGWATADELTQIGADIDRELDEAVAEAEKSPMPEPLEALTDVYGDGPVNAPWTRYAPADPTRA